ncbi:hypothetical protein RJD39_21365 [Vibrio scophthalmi]|uniref:hypothetical protein n=1 Tax=Vibrio scophthalmi TaxID=45658 RepID=UPI0038734B8C
MRKLTNIGMFYGELGKESGRKELILTRMKTDEWRERINRIMPILPALHNAALSGEQRDHPSLNLATFSNEADLD